LTRANVSHCGVPRLDGTHAYGGVWVLREDSVDKVLQYLGNSIGENCLLAGDDGEHLVIGFS
jgi:hypothetical protein